MREIFEKIYQDNLWESPETRSGIGSEVAHTHAIRSQLASIINLLKIKVFIDAPCGDFNWIQKMDLSEVQYIGVDILPGVIETLTQRYATPSLKFVTSDITQDPLPAACLMLTRDCLVHFSYHDINRFLANLHRSQIKYLVATTFTDRSHNYDIVTGDWRPLNLQIAPFHFPEPLQVINEKFQAYEGLFPDKSLAVYRVEDLPRCLKTDSIILDNETNQTPQIGRHC